MVADLCDAAALHDDDAVCVLHGADALGDDELGRVGQIACQPCANLGVGLGVDGAGGVVQDQDLGATQQGACNAQALLLTARNIRAALFDPGVVALGEAVDKLVGAGQMRCLADFLVGGVRVAPTQVLGDGAAKQHVFLQHHGDLVTQRVQVVVAHVHAAHAHSAFGGVVQAGDEVNERGLGRAGAADDADGLAARNVQVDIVERLALRMLGILKAHVVKVDGTVGNLEHGLGGIGDRGLGGQHLGNAVCRFVGHGHHDKDHRQLHQAHENLETIGKGRGELAHVEQRALARDDELGAQVDDDDKRAVDADVHHGVVKGEQLLGAGEVHLDVARGGRELLLLKVFANIALDHAHAGDVFLDRLVKGIVLVEHAREDGAHLKDDKEQSKAQQRNDDQVDHGNAAAHDKRHGKGEDQDQRRAHGDADDHHKGLLHVVDVSGQTRDERGTRELIDVGKAERLDLVEQVVTQVLGEAATRMAAGDARGGAKGERRQRDEHQKARGGKHLGYGGAVFDGVDQVGGDKWNQHLAEHLAKHEQRRGNSDFHIVADASHEGFNHPVPPRLRGFYRAFRRGPRARRG